MRHRGRDGRRETLREALLQIVEFRCAKFNSIKFAIVPQYEY